MLSGSSPQHQNIAVAGLGYVGCVTAACLARLGRHVIGVDLDEHKVNAVRAGKAPFYEPGLDDLVRAMTAERRLTATTSLAEALDSCSMVLICVGTPPAANGELMLDQVERVCREIRQACADRSAPLVIALRSTVPPGSCEALSRLFDRSAPVSLVMHPEFLREGSALGDFFEPSLLVIGSDDREAAAAVSALYEQLPVEPCYVSVRAAEMIKFACNSFHAAKIAFANEVGTLCRALDISPFEVMDTFCRDTRLNISPAYLRPGFAFGGSCLPKDLKAIVRQGARFDIHMPLLASVLPSNHEHLLRAVHLALALPSGERIGIYGLAFKNNTDDLRESPVISLIESLIGKGRDLCVFDPHICIDAIYGSNRRFALSAIPHIGRLLASDIAEFVRMSDHILLTQKPTEEFTKLLEASGKPFTDLAGLAGTLPKLAAV